MKNIRLSKLKTDTRAFGRIKNGQKMFDFLMDVNCIQHIVAIVFPRSLYLFHCGIQNNAVGDNFTFAFAVTHHQNSSQ